MSCNSQRVGWCTRRGTRLSSHILDAHGEILHVPHRLGAAQLDRPLVVLLRTAAAQRCAPSVLVHHRELAGRVAPALSRGPLEPRPCLLEVHSDTAAVVVHRADLPLAQSITPLRTDLVRRHRSRVVDRDPFAPVVDGADGPSCFEVALSDGWCERVSANSSWHHLPMAPPTNARSPDPSPPGASRSRCPTPSAATTTVEASSYGGVRRLHARS